MKKLRAAGGLDPANRENVENYSNTTSSGYSSARVGSSSSITSSSSATTVTTLERRYTDNSQEQVRIAFF